MLRNSLFVVVTLSLFGTSSFAADEITKLEGSDLAVETKKWKGKKVETVMRCFYADVEEYRCIGEGARARVDFSIISNEEGKQHLEKNCDTITKMARDVCRLRIRFVYEDFDRIDRANRSITIISAEDQKGEVFPVDRRRRYKATTPNIKETTDILNFSKKKLP